LALNGTLGGTGTLTAASYTLNGATVNANLGAGTLTQAGGVSVLNGTAAAATANVNAGTLTLGASNRLADTAAVTVATGATLNMVTFNDTVGTLALNGTLGGTGTLTAASYALSGATVNANLGAGTLTQAGGVSVLNGTAAAATANVNAGTLTLGASNRLADTAAVTVATGATLNMVTFNDTVGTLALNGTLNGTGTLTALTYTLNSATVNGNLGAGTLTQAGGTSTLTGTVAATTVAINAGILRLGAADRITDTAQLTLATGTTFDLANFAETIGSLSGVGAVTLGSGTLSVGAANTVSTYGGTLTGTGDLTKVGTGTLSLTGIVALTGRLNVNAGTLLLNGSTPGSVRVQGGTFGGNATVAGALTLSSGTIAPGNATQRIGQIQAASLTTTGGTLAIDFGGTTSGFTADSLKITGAASLSGTMVSTAAVDSTASYNFSQTYQVLQAGSITGTFGNGSTFAQVSTDTPDLYWRLRTDLVPNAVMLEVRKLISFGTTLGAGSTANQAAVGGGLTTTELTGSESWNTFLNTIANETPAQRQTTFDSIGGESIANISSSAASISSSFVSLLRRRLATGGSGDSSLVAGLLGGQEGLATVRASTLTSDQASAFAGGSGSRGSAWVQGFGGTGRVQGRDGTATLNDDSYGIAAGLDGRIGMITLGAAFAAASLDTRIPDRAATNKGTLYQGGGYAAYDNGNAYASLIGNYFSGDVDSKRQVVVGGVSQGLATGTANVHGVTIGATAGYRIPVGTNSRFTPQASIEGTQVVRGSFTENGAGLLNLVAARQTRTLYTATLEGRFNHVVQSGTWSIEPYIGGGVAIQFGDRDTLASNRFSGAPVGTGAFTIEGVRLAPVVGLVNFGIQAHPSKNLTLGIGAEGRLGDHQRDGRLEAHVRLGF
ncbi:MAG: autotransporter domain-containing protein, partial [Pseudomonadota bacterium]